MSNSVFILHHSGLGDHIICNGMIRELKNKYHRVYYPVKFRNLKNIERMFEDISDVMSYIPIRDDLDMINSSQQHAAYCDILKTGVFEGPRFMREGENFCEAFYRQSSIPYAKRWESFHAPRKEDKENILFALLNPKEPYIFVHDDASRNLTIRKEFLENKTIFRPPHSLGAISEFDLIDYRKLFAEAKEIHCMDSSFAALIDHIPELKDTKKYIHRYIRKENANPIYNNGWEIIND